MASLICHKILLHISQSLEESVMAIDEQKIKIQAMIDRMLTLNSFIQEMRDEIEKTMSTPLDDYKLKSTKYYLERVEIRHFDEFLTNSLIPTTCKMMRSFV